MFALATSLILISYSFYTKPGDKTLIVGGFALVSDADITLKVYVEDKDNMGVGLGTYSRVYYIPTVDYEYYEENTYCTDGITINSFENGQFDISASKRGFCKVYFNVLNGNAPSGNFSLFVEQTKDASDYVEMGSLPNNDYLYTVNSSKTTCSDASATVEVVKRRIEITSKNDVTCDVYVDIEATSGGGSMYLSDKVLALESPYDYTSSQDQTIYKVAHETVEYEGQTLDAGVRYEGKDPDNYVTFNGETAGWRIIGVFEGSTIGLEPGKQYTKIIKATSLGNFAWDEYQNGAYENDWENATLKTYLNGEYLNGLSDASKIAKYNNNYSTWYLKALDEGTHTGDNAYTPQWYLGERYTGYTGYKDGVQYGAKAEIKAAIGLMYPSDYGYAAYGIECDNKSSMTLYNYEGGCAAVDWLAQDSLDSHEEWLISPSPGRSSSAFIVIGGSGGSVNYVTDLSFGFAARPTLYLSSDIFITGGSGKASDPYTIDL